MDETEYHRLADATLRGIMERLESEDENGDLDCELQSGVLTVELPSGKQFVISKHTPSRQIWLSSPVSGGLHFRAEGNQWKLPDGRELVALLEADMKKL
jgi:CyaY protein